MDTTSAVYVWEVPLLPAVLRARGRRGQELLADPALKPPLRPPPRPAGPRADPLGRARPRGSRRTRRSSSTRAAPTCASTHCVRRVTCASSWRVSCSPSRRRRWWWSRQDCPTAGTSTGALWTSPTSSRHRPGRPVPTRAGPRRTGRRASATGSTRLVDYDFPTRQLLPIAGLVAFYDEQVDVVLDGIRQERRHQFS